MGYLVVMISVFVDRDISGVIVVVVIHIADVHLAVEFSIVVVADERDQLLIRCDAIMSRVDCSVMGQKAGQRLRETHLLDPSDRGGASSQNLVPTFYPTSVIEEKQSSLLHK